jgi:hypothetical protein
MEQRERLHQLYEEGLTSLEEERMLREKSSINGNSSNPWFEYIRRKRQEVPGDIENQIWEKVEAARRKSRRIFSAAITAAASLLIITLITTTLLTGGKEMNRKEITAALEEAMSMIPGELPDNGGEEIIYEDESIIIYIEE